MKLENMGLEISSQVPRLESFMVKIISTFPSDRKILSANPRKNYFQNLSICTKRLLLKNTLLGNFNSVSSVTQSFLTLQPHGLKHARPPCPSPAPGVYSNSCPSSQWCHPAISSSVVPFSSCSHSLPASGSFQMCQLSASGGQSIGVSASASVLPMNILKDWFPLGWTGWISLQSKGLSRVFSNTTVQKHQFFCA